MTDKFKKLRYGGFSVLLTVIIVAIVVFLNVLVNTVLSRFDVKLDLTTNKIYSIEEETTKFVKSIEDTIYIKFAMEENEIANNTTFVQINEIAKRFAESNKNIEISYIDLLINPTFSGMYGGTITETNIVVQSKNTGRYKVLSYSDYLDVKYYDPNGNQITEDEAYTYYYMGYEPLMDMGSAAEQAFMSAILLVTNETPVNVAFTTGFGESNASTSRSGATIDALKSALELNSYNIQTVDMNAVEKIDESIDFIVIFAPYVDYSVETVDKLASWLDNSGNYGKNLVYIPSYVTLETPNLDSLLTEWGLKVEKGLIYQADTTYAFADQLQYYARLAESAYNDGTNKKNILGLNSRPITALFTNKGEYSITPLITTHDGAAIYYGNDTYGEEKGVLNIGIESSKTRYSGTTPFTSRVIAFGSPDLFSSSTMGAEQFGNSSFYMSVFNTISGKEEGVYIKPKSYAATTFEVTAKQINLITLVFCVILPLWVLAMGVFVFVRRRHR